jgi:hypothetical protein
VTKKRGKPLEVFGRRWETEVTKAGHDLFHSINHEAKEKEKHD